MLNCIFGIRTAIFSVLALACVTTSAAHARDFRVEVKKCNAPKGSIAVKDIHAQAWSSLSVDDPTQFIKSAFAQSNCFNVVNSGARAKYWIVVGPLTKDEFDAGPDQFAGRPSIGSAGAALQSNGGAAGGLDGMLKGGLGSLLGSSKMNYAFVDITDAAGGVLARGFGRGNATRLDYSHWSFDQTGVQSFNRSKKSRRAGGALFNAFHEAKKTVLSSNFASAKPVYAKAGTSAVSGKSTTQISARELLLERGKNPERFFNKYAATKGGKYVTLTGFVGRSSAQGKWIHIASRKTRQSTNPLDNISCENVVNSGKILNLDRGDPITVRGVLTILTKYKVFSGTYGLGDPMAIRRCSIAAN